MKILSFNCRGLAGSLKRTSLYRLVELNQPNIMMLQETMGEEVVIIPWLFSLLKTWEFVGSDARGHSGGLAIGWNPKQSKL
jgi:exonuclease III